MIETYEKYFRYDLEIIEKALKSINLHCFEELIEDCVKTINSGHKIIASGLGKNVPICEKFVGTLLSFGIDANFLHTNTAVHGDLGMIRDGDLVIVLTKSGSTAESVFLVKHVKKRSATIWLLSFEEHSVLADSLEKKLILSLEAEGDQWNISPNNSTIINLIVLQAIAIEMSKRLNVTLEEFSLNHPGGAIGEFLNG
ncbi:MAG: SIS domain-containing protein [Lachnospiraceae bacterium]|nr:SIS domain-containing protein [Lachnospiraceae bacterium]